MVQKIPKKRNSGEKVEYPKKINMESENDGFQKEPPFPRTSLWGMVIPSLGNPSLGGGFKDILFSPRKLGKKISNLTHIFQMG